MIRKSPLLVASLLGILGLLSSGCISTGMARTLDRGQFQVSVTPGVQAVKGIENPGVTLPQGEIGIRYGLTDRLDAGVRLFGLGVEADARFGLLRAPSLRRGVELTLAPSVSYAVHRYTSFDDGSGMVQLPLLIGVNMEGYHLVLGPRAAYAYGRLSPSSGDGGALLVGTSLGLAVPIGRWFHLMPEVSLLQQPTKSLGEHVLLHAGVGLIFGGYKEE